MVTGVVAFFSSMGGFGTQTISTLFFPVRVHGILGGIRTLSSMLPAFIRHRLTHTDDHVRTWGEDGVYSPGERPWEKPALRHLDLRF